MVTTRVSFATPPTSESGESSPARPVVDFGETNPKLTAARADLCNLAHLVIVPERLTFVDRRLGWGHYSHVTLAKLDESSHTRDVAVKRLHVLDLEMLGSARIEIRLARQLKVWQALKHPNVLELLGFYLSPKGGIAQFISPYLINGNIADYMRRAFVGIDQQLRFVRDITAGLDYLHGLNPPICHGHLSPDNILLDNNFNAVLSGFGLAEVYDISTNPSDLTPSKGYRLSLSHTSPELLLAETPKLSPPSDVWAWGCTTFEILTREEPFHNSEQIVLSILNRRVPGQADLVLSLVPDPPRPEYASTLRLLHSYLPLCWEYEPRKRPPISVILRQAFVFSPENNPEDSVDAILKELTHFLIPSDRLHIFERSPLGTGNFGQVVLGTLDESTPNPKEVAVKKLKLEGNRGERIRLIKRLARELNVWARINHPNVLQLIGYCLDGKYESPLLISALMINGSVLDYVQRYKPDVEKRINFVKGITAGLACLHASDPPIYHADLKPANVLVDLHMNAVLCDFGLASFVSNSAASPGLVTSTTPRGTPRYMSPEITLYDDFKHTLENDVWAWACTVFEVLTGSIPYVKAFKAESIIVAMIQESVPGDVNLLLPDEIEGVRSESTLVLQLLHSALPQCWDFDPENRPPICTLLSQISNPPSELEAPTRVNQGVESESIQEESKLVDRLENPSGKCAPSNGAQRDEQNFRRATHLQDEMIPEKNLEVEQSGLAVKGDSDGEERGKEDQNIVHKGSEGTRIASGRSSLIASIQPLSMLILAIACALSVCGNIYFLLRKDIPSP